MLHLERVWAQRKRNETGAVKKVRLSSYFGLMQTNCSCPKIFNNHKMGKSNEGRVGLKISLGRERMWRNSL